VGQFGEQMNGVFEDVVRFGGGFDDAVEDAVSGKIIVLVADEDEGGFIGIHVIALAEGIRSRHMG
jgi:hypothetical protein